MAFTQADIDKLKKAIALGALRVRFADREVQYRTLGEMRDLLTIMQREVDDEAGKARPPRTRAIRFLTGKGF